MFGITKKDVGVTLGSIIALGIMKKYYDGPLEEYLNDQGWDVVLPIIAYNLDCIKNKLNVEGVSPLKRASIIFGLCSAGELAQYLNLYSGTYDPNDFPAYAIGSGLALVSGMIVKKIKQKHNSIDSLVD